MTACPASSAAHTAPPPAHGVRDDGTERDRRRDSVRARVDAVDRRAVEARSSRPHPRRRRSTRPRLRGRRILGRTRARGRSRCAGRHASFAAGEPGGAEAERRARTGGRAGARRRTRGKPDAPGSGEVGGGSGAHRDLPEPRRALRPMRAESCQRPPRWKHEPDLGSGRGRSRLELKTRPLGPTEDARPPPVARAARARTTSVAFQALPAISGRGGAESVTRGPACREHAPDEEREESATRPRVASEAMRRTRLGPAR